MKSGLLSVLLLLNIIMFSGTIEPVQAGPDPALGMVINKTGVLERRPGASAEWRFAGRDTVIRNGDRFKTGSKGVAALELPGKCRLYMNRHTVLTVNASLQNKNGTQLNDITLLRGEVILVAGESQSQRFHHQVLTAEAVARTEDGACFLVRADPADSVTLIQVFNGVIAGKNVLDKNERYLRAGKKQYVDRGRPLPPAEPLNQDDYHRAKWINRAAPGVLAREIKKNRIRTERLRAVLSASGNDRIIIVRFSNRSGYKGKWPLEKAIPRSLAADLLSSGYDNVEYDDVSSSLSYLRSLTGKATMVIMGKITAFDLVRRTAKTQDGKTEGLIECKAGLSLRLVSVSERQVIGKISVRDVRVDKESRSLAFATLLKRPFSLADSAFRNSTAGKTLISLLQKARLRLAEYLTL